jgi:hypothetical protein
MATISIDAVDVIVIPPESRRDFANTTRRALSASWARLERWQPCEPDPFALLAADALQEYRAGETRSLADFAREHGVSLGESEPLPR